MRQARNDVPRDDASARGAVGARARWRSGAGRRRLGGRGAMRSSDGFVAALRAGAYVVAHRFGGGSGGGMVQSRGLRVGPTRIPFHDGVPRADDRSVGMHLGWVLGKTEGRNEPGEAARVRLAFSLVDEIRNFVDQLPRASGPHVLEHAHVPQILSVVINVLVRHVFRSRRLDGEVPVAE